MYHISIITSHADEDDFGERLGDIAHVAYCPVSSEQQIIECCCDADVIICRDEMLTAPVLEQLEELKLIVVLSSRYDHIDMAATAERGIVVINTPEYCVEDIADHTCAMMLALLRQLPEYQYDIRKHSRWQYGTVPWKMHRISHNVIGLVGFGRVGQAVASRMHAFGCRIRAYDPFVSEKLMMEQRVKPVDFDTLLQTCDVVSLHMPLNDATRYLFREEQFEQMKEGSVFVNCCRGGLVDEAALFHAVDDGRIRSAALDVLSMDHPGPMLLKMLDRPEFLLTPHCGCHSIEADKEAHAEAARYIRDFLDGKFDDLPIVNIPDC
jgi:D-3-phosphoglycerate dehydrogenase